MDGNGDAYQRHGSTGGQHAKRVGRVAPVRADAKLAAARKAGDEDDEVPAMPPWATAVIVILVGAALGLAYTAYERHQRQRESASISAFLDVVSDGRYWDAVRDAGYRPRMRPDFSDGTAHVDLTCVREVSCAPPPTRANLKSTIIPK